MLNFIELDSKNHILQEDEPAWVRFKEAVLEFVGQRSNSSEHDRFASLSRREREILTLITGGLGNAEITKRLSSVCDKLGVKTRAQALVFARDHGFRP